MVMIPYMTEDSLDLSPNEQTLNKEFLPETICSNDIASLDL